MARSTNRVDQPPKRRACGTMAAHMLLLEQHPSFREQQFRLEQDTARMRAVGFDARAQKPVTIRVVVNVVYNTDEQNVSDAQIASQIKVLNADYAATNPDHTKTPAPWLGLVSPTGIAFKLLKVTRTKTATTSFTTDDAVKSAAGGGIAPTDPTKNLNLWVCALSGGILGYAQFPGGPNATDGVVINYVSFGTSGTAASPFDQGRTATHEVGHYFNLRHIWGDTEDCSGSDFVSDTPNAAGPNFGKPAWPVITCNNGPNGDMFMNYMDYVDDDAMFMFSAQQVVRMRAALAGPRSGLTT